MTNGSPLSPFERWLLWTSGTLTTVTGVAYLWMKHFMEPVALFAAINHPWQPIMLKAHIVVAPMLVFGLGVISVRHIWTHFANGVGRGRRSGISTAVISVVLVVTGYLIQAITAEGVLRAVSYVHIGVGTVFAVGFVGHVLGVRLRAPNGDDTQPDR